MTASFICVVQMNHLPSLATVLARGRRLEIDHVIESVKNGTIEITPPRRRTANPFGREEGSASLNDALQNDLKLQELYRSVKQLSYEGLRAPQVVREDDHNLLTVLTPDGSVKSYMIGEGLPAPVQTENPEWCSYFKIVDFRLTHCLRQINSLDKQVERS